MRDLELAPPLCALAMIAFALSCEEAHRITIPAVWRGPRDTGRIVDAGAAQDAAAPADAARDGDADAGCNAFELQKPLPKGLIVEYSPSPHRFLPVHTTEADVNRFIDGLKGALRAKNRAAIADAINYPLVVATGRSQLVVEDRDDFLRRYDRVMTASVVNAIRNANASNVRIAAKAITLGSGENRLVGYLGMAMGNDQIWFDLAEVHPVPTLRHRLLIRMVNATPGR
jgi:hypothetical protein